RRLTDVLASGLLSKLMGRFTNRKIEATKVVRGSSLAETRSTTIGLVSVIQQLRGGKYSFGRHADGDVVNMTAYTQRRQHEAPELEVEKLSFQQVDKTQVEVLKVETIGTDVDAPSCRSVTIAENRVSHPQLLCFQPQDGGGAALLLDADFHAF